MAKEPVSIKLTNATLDERDGVIVAHGWLDPDAMSQLLVGDYQREVLGSTASGSLPKIAKAARAGARFPDIVLGMRGQRYTSRGSSMFLEDDTFIVDGLQRIAALRAIAIDDPSKIPSLRIGAEVRFDTTKESERDLFEALNTNRTPMAPGVLLRNARHSSPGVLTLYGLTKTDAKFALYDRVSWNQRMSRNELLKAMVYARSVLTLHRWTGSATRTTSVKMVPEYLDKTMDKITMRVFRENIVTFFNAIDDIWNIRGVKYVDLNTHLRGNFLVTLARVMSDHTNFWDGNRLVIDGITKAKMKTFGINDPAVQRLAGGGSSASSHLYNLLRDHLNKGKRINRLVPRNQPVAQLDGDETEDASEGE